MCLNRHLISPTVLKNGAHSPPHKYFLDLSFRNPSNHKLLNKRIVSVKVLVFVSLPSR